MVRMCEKKIIAACAMTLVAGSAASAQLNINVGSAEATTDAPIVRNTINLDAGFQAYAASKGIELSVSLAARDSGNPCEYDWDQLDAATPFDGQVSHMGGTLHEFCDMAADDFVLCDGFVYKMREIRGLLITNTRVQDRRAVAFIFEDDNGKPGGAPIAILNSTDSNTVTTIGGGFDIEEYIFDINNQPEPRNAHEDGPEVGLEDNLIFCGGGCYWVAIVGVSDNQFDSSRGGPDVSFFAAAATDRKLAQAHKAPLPCPDPTKFANDVLEDDAFDFAGFPRGTAEPRVGGRVEEWTALDECCIGCVDLAFSVEWDECKIIHDMGDAVSISNGDEVTELGARSERSPDTFRYRLAADNFFSDPCEDRLLCYVEACILTNCDVFSAQIDLFRNDCDKPSFILSDPSTAGENFFNGGDLGVTPTIIEQVDGPFNLLENGVALSGDFYKYRVVWCLKDQDPALTDNERELEACENYWLSVSVEDTFSFAERAYWLFSDNGVKISPAAVIEDKQAEEWTCLDRDLNFKVARDVEELINGGDTATGGDTVTCAADYNSDGTASVGDILDFLSDWSLGCP